MTDPAPGASPRRDWFSTMVRIRAFEDKVQELFMSGEIGGTTHLCQGQEAVSVGSIAAMAAGRRADEHVPRPRRGARARHDARDRVRRAHGQGDGRIGRRRWLDAPHRLLEGQHRRQCDRRGRPADRRRGRRRVPDAAPAQRGADVLRRWRDQYRDVPRGAQHGGALEGAGRLHHHQQPVRRVLAAGDDDGRRRPRPARRCVRHPRAHRRRPGHRRRTRHRRYRHRPGARPARARRCSR